jgi:hypothetical protein
MSSSIEGRSRLRLITEGPGAAIETFAPGGLWGFEIGGALAILGGCPQACVATRARIKIIDCKAGEHPPRANKKPSVVFETRSTPRSPAVCARRALVGVLVIVVKAV